MSGEEQVNYDYGYEDMGYGDQGGNGGDVDYGYGDSQDYGYGDSQDYGYGDAADMGYGDTQDMGYGDQGEPAKPSDAPKDAPRRGKQRRNSCVIRKDDANPLAVAEFLVGGPPKDATPAGSS